MVRYQIILSYDGTEFVGSQRQGLGRTVQGEVEKALRRIGWEGKTILLAGRTDSGVHAEGQVATVDLNWGHSLEDLCKAINTNLPLDIVTRSVNIVPDNFHPRFDAKSRQYRYCIYCAGVRDPFKERYAWRVWPEVTGLQELAKIWIGKHDFAAFGAPAYPNGNTRRTVFNAGWTNDGAEWTFEIEADAFLYHMVRRLVFVQVAAGNGRITTNDLGRALKKPRKLLPGLAPAQGLSLINVKYD